MIFKIKDIRKIVDDIEDSLCNFVPYVNIENIDKVLLKIAKEIIKRHAK